VNQVNLCNVILSGGLLITVPNTEAELFLKDLKEKDVEWASIIVAVTEQNPRRIHVI
jgi:selenide, water dikinase